MAKRFDIQEWIAKQKLAEQEDFTPDLEDDDLKRSKVQQMMAKEKEPAGGDEKLRNNVEAIADMYSYGEILDALESFYTKNDEQVYAEMARKHAKEFRDFLDNGNEDEMFMGDWGPHLAEEELDEANVTGTGTSISTGNSPAYATPGAFAKNKEDWENKDTIYEEDEEGEGEELSRDAEVLKKLVDSKINTKDEWVDMFQILMAHSDEIQGLSDSQIKSLLQQSLKDI
jgi:hypothetical protein